MTDTGIVRAQTRHHQILRFIAIQVRDSDRTGQVATTAVGSCCLKSTITVAQTHLHHALIKAAVSSTLLGTHDVRFSVSIHVCHCDGAAMTPGSRSINHRLFEGSISVAQTDGYPPVGRRKRTACCVPHNEVEMAIAIHVRHRYRNRPYPAGTVGHSRLESPVTVAQHLAYAPDVGTGIGVTQLHRNAYQQVWLAVFVYIRSGYS